MIRLLSLVPATNVGTEHTASTVRQRKTYFRSATCEARFNNAMLLTTDQEKNNKLDIAEIANQLIDNSNRFRNFGRFTENDMMDYVPVESKSKYTQTDS